MPDRNLDPPTREHIEALVKEERRLLAQQTLADSDHRRLREIHVALDRCWDVMRQRWAVRQRRRSPDQPRIPPPAFAAKDGD